MKLVAGCKSDLIIICLILDSFWLLVLFLAFKFRFFLVDSPFYSPLLLPFFLPGQILYWLVFFGGDFLLEFPLEFSLVFSLLDILLETTRHCGCFFWHIFFNFFWLFSSFLSPKNYLDFQLFEATIFFACTT